MVVLKNVSYLYKMAPLTEWKMKATAIQENFSNLFADRVWDEFQYPEEKDNLWNKIAFSLYERPSEYKSEQKEVINDLYNKTAEYCRKNFKNVYIAFIFTCTWGKVETVVPVIRIRYKNDENIRLSYFLDHTGRVYDTWSKYLEDNIWDQCYICVPENGKYVFGIEPDFFDQLERGKVVETLDTISTVSTLTTTATSLVGLGLTFFPPTALIGGILLTSSAIVGAPAVTYSTGRSVTKLVDRATHDQSINPFESCEARACYLTTAASVLSVATLGSSALLTSSAKAGNLVSATTRGFCTALNITSLSINGLGVINGLVEVAKKDEVTSLDVLQLTTSIFFFTHACVTFKTASGIIKDAQNVKISEIRESLTAENAQISDNMLQNAREMIEPGKTRVMHGNVKFIKRMANIEDKNTFFQHFKLKSDGQLNIHNELVIHPKAFLQMSEDYQNKILDTSDKLQSGAMNIEQFNTEIKFISKEYRIRFENQRQLSIDNICKAFKTDNLDNIKIHNESIFKDLKPHEIDRLDQVLQESCKKYSEDCIQLGFKIAEEQNCKNLTEFCAATEYAIRQVDKQVTEMRKQNPNPKLPHGDKLKDYYSKEVYKKVLNSKAEIKNISNSFNDLRVNCDTPNNSGHPGFGNSMAAANHYDKHAFFPKIDPQNNLPAERYFEIAREMTSGPVVNPKWTQNGKSLCCQFHSPEYGAFAVSYNNLADGITVIATLMRETKPIQTQVYRR